MDFKKRLLVKPKSRCNLKRFDPNDKGGLEKEAAKLLFAEKTERLQQLQYTLYAENKHSVLVVLQAMDAGGKDSTIRNVFGPLNPQGVRVASFKKPTERELAHDFLWRVHSKTPGRGEISVFNRSHYEDVLVVRVHDIVPKSVWRARYDHINHFEKLLTTGGTTVVKFYLHISEDEQLERLVDRLDTPHKFWKANPGDFEERKCWKDYQRAFEGALSACSTPWAPWYVIPANRKWFRNLAIASILVDTLEALKMKIPEPAFDVEEIKKTYCS